MQEDPLLPLAHWVGKYGRRTGMSLRIEVDLPKVGMEEVSASLREISGIVLEVRRWPGTKEHFWFADRKNAQLLMRALEPYREQVPGIEGKWVPRVKANFRRGDDGRGGVHPAGEELG